MSFCSIQTDVQSTKPHYINISNEQPPYFYAMENHGYSIDPYASSGEISPCNSPTRERPKEPIPAEKSPRPMLPIPPDYKERFRFSPCIPTIQMENNGSGHNQADDNKTQESIAGTTSPPPDASLIEEPLPNIHNGDISEVYKAQSQRVGDICNVKDNALNNIETTKQKRIPIRSGQDLLTDTGKKEELFTRHFLSFRFLPFREQLNFYVQLEIRT